MTHLRTPSIPTPGSFASRTGRALTLIAVATLPAWAMAQAMPAVPASASGAAQPSSAAGQPSAAARGAAPAPAGMSNQPGVANLPSASPLSGGPGGGYIGAAPGGYVAGTPFGYVGAPTAAPRPAAGLSSTDPAQVVGPGQAAGPDTPAFGAAPTVRRALPNREGDVRQRNDRRIFQSGDVGVAPR